MEFLSRPFSELSNTELFRILELRSKVFVVEQQCVYQDPDENDLNAIHVFAVQNGIYCAYARIIPPSANNGCPRIGRVVVNPDFRKKGLGRKLMTFCLENCRVLFPGKMVDISAQTYLDRFYCSLGFVPLGEEYLEDGIPHRKMRFFSGADAS